jgi:uncharacterized protein DUF4136
MRNAAAIAIALTLLAEPLLHAVDIKVIFDKTFDFKQIRAWTWSPAGGEVKMLTTAQDDPAVVKKRFEPVIMDAVATHMTARGYSQGTAEADVRLTYYVLISAGAAAQTMGQFLPATTAWGLPPFTPQTSSLSVIEQGSLVLDLASVKLDEVIWRGVASAEVNRAMTEEKRDARVRDAIKSLIAKLPKRT